MNFFRVRILIIAALIMPAFYFLSLNVSADTIGQTSVFNVTTKYDQLSRTSLGATLRVISSHAYFYVEDRYWNGLDINSRNSLNQYISSLAQEFDNNIYPTETQFWGSEPNPGIDGDPKITILLEDLISGNGGYFNTANEFSKAVSADSNEREMISINAGAVSSGLAKVFLGHEFQHLISSNQKELKNRIQEDVWLNELRSEYAASLLGYNNNFNGSNLERRVGTFLENPSDSLTEWPNVSTDYGEVNLFGEYLVEQYGPAILSETLQSPYSGIDSINQYLLKHNLSERFSNIFENWTIANYLNDISSDKRYGYSRTELKFIHITPSQTTLFYPNSISFNDSLKPWQQKWSQFYVNNLPDSKSVKIDLTSSPALKVIYTDNLGRVGTLSYPVGYISNPGGLRWFILMPINESKTSGFTDVEASIPVSAIISFVDVVPAVIADGALIKRPGEAEMYVVAGKYKRYLRPEIIKLYGQLDPSKVIELDDKTFNSYTTANYVRYVNDKKVYAIWPDGTKHWLNMTGDYFTQSGRDWNAIFIINESEFNSYKIGPEIKK